MAKCRSCESPDLQGFYAVPDLPVHSNQLLASRDEALAGPRGDLSLALCRLCGFVQNDAYDPSLQDYAESYEDTQAHSALFNRFAGALVEGLFARHGLRGQSVLEIGCGRGDFLIRLCAAGLERGIGIDPAFRPSGVSASAGPGVRFIADSYSERYADLEADLVFCRHTLEHIAEVGTFIGMLRANLGDRRDTVVYFEVPALERILAEDAFWDLYYEHCSYFAASSLRRLFEANGFEVLRLTSGYQGQYLLLEARPRGIGVGDESLAGGAAADLARQTADFGERVRGKLSGWRERLGGWRAAGLTVALWGAGSKAVGFLTTLHVTDEVACVVDINPAKQGMFQAGTGHPIVAPADLIGIQPDRMIAMNPIYRGEIEALLRSLGLPGEVGTL
ncbi:MAG: class I SAM-dependent methyltransferase [Myxococcota bacterium]